MPDSLDLSLLASSKSKRHNAGRCVSTSNRDCAAFDLLLCLAPQIKKRPCFPRGIISTKFDVTFLEISAQCFGLDAPVAQRAIGANWPRNLSDVFLVEFRLLR